MPWISDEAICEDSLRKPEDCHGLSGEAMSRSTHCSHSGDCDGEVDEVEVTPHLKENQRRLVLDPSDCGVGEIVLEGYDFKYLAFFGDDGSSAEEVSMDCFCLEAVFDVEGFNVEFLALCTHVSISRAEYVINWNKME